MRPPPRLRDVHIFYHRPPDRTDRFVQKLVHDDGRTKITFASGLRLDGPLMIDDEVVLEDGSDAVWFTFPGAWHDIGRFHRADGTHTGIYANILTPCVFEPGGSWHTTDLFLDLWIPAPGEPGGMPRILDREELREAERLGWVEARDAARARKEADRLSARARAGEWPPRVVREWTRERTLEAMDRDRVPAKGPARS